MLIAPSPSLPLSRAPAGQPPVHIGAVTTAYPAYSFSQQDALAEAGRIFGHNAALMDRMASAYGNAGVRTRYSCVPLAWYAQPHGWPERTRLYEEHALALLTRAGRNALRTAGVDGADIAATVTVSSTGIATPSLDSLLQGPLGLTPTVQRLPVFGLGCAGGVIGLSRAAALARAMPGQWILFLCVELCGLTFRAADDSKQNIVATAIFGDGAAAVLSERGNMSAVTVLAVLERTLAAKERGMQMMTALGPGFSAAMCLLDLG